MNVISSYSFRDRQGFHDTVAWTGNGAGSRTIPHNINGAVGMTIVRCQNGTTISTTTKTYFKHIDVSGSTVRRMENAGSSTSAMNPTDDNNINITNIGFNGTGLNYVAELFAHNPTQGIYCGFYTGNGTTQKITTGFTVGLLITPTSGGTLFADIETGTG